ncbi:MAG: geranylgeranyl reductase family protein [Gemmatimonadales bacterium]
MQPTSEISETRGDATSVPWQRHARELEDERWDAIVVGGGPAGSTAAIHLASRGRRVLVLERHAFPRDKACGDLLIPDAQRVLGRLGLLEAVAARARSVDDAVVESPSRLRWSIPGRYLVLPRRTFDGMLAREASARGAVVARGRVTALEPRPDGSVEVSVSGRPRALRARSAILAAGADVALGETLGMVERRSPTAFAVRAYVTSRHRLEPLLLSFDRKIVPGYAWIFPLPGDVYNVGVGVVNDGRAEAPDLRALFRTFTDAVPEARALLAAAVATEPLRGARLRCGLEGSRARGPGNIVAAGEQIATTYPFTGEGIGKAMESGDMAAEQVALTLETGDARHLDEYARRIDEELRPRFRGYAVAQRWLARPWLNDLVAWRIRRAGYLRDAVRGIVAETVDPAEVFSWRGVVRSLTG